MNFTDTAIFKLAHCFGTTEVIVFLSADEIKSIRYELEESAAGKNIIAEMEVFKDVAHQDIDMQMYKFNGTIIHVGDKEKLMELILQSKSQSS
jgi:hypothetical protein